MRCCYVVSRPPAKFHHIRSSFDAPTINYSGNSSRSNARRFRSPKTIARLHSPSFLLAQALLHSPPRPSLPPLCVEHRPLSRVRNCPEPDSGSRHRWAQIIPKHLQNITVFLFGLPSYLFATIRLRSEGPGAPNQKFTCYIFILPN